MTTGLLKSIIDTLNDKLDEVDGLRVYKYPTRNIQEFPAAIIRDAQATTHASLAEYSSTAPSAVYHLEVVILVDMADEQEAYEELEKYVSEDSYSSIKRLLDGAVNPAGVQSIDCERAESRRLLDLGDGSRWGCVFWITSIAT